MGYKPEIDEWDFQDMLDRAPVDPKKCRCGETRILAVVYDSGINGDESGHSYAYNLYICHGCGSLVRENVWSNLGICISYPWENF